MVKLGFLKNLIPLSLIVVFDTAKIRQIKFTTAELNLLP